MDSNSRFVRNARDFQVLLLNEEIRGSIRDLYVTQQDLDYMKRIFSVGSVQTTLGNFIYIFSTEASDNIHVEYINWLEQRIWKI